MDEQTKKNKKRPKNGRKIASLVVGGVFALGACFCAVCGQNSTIETSAEIGSTSPIDGGSYFWGSGGETVYEIRTSDETVGTLYRSTSFPVTLKSVLPLLNITNRTTFFINNAGANVEEMEKAYSEYPCESITYRQNDVNIAYTCLQGGDVSFYLETVFHQIKGRRVVDLGYFCDSLSSCQFAGLGAKRVIGGATVYDLTSGNSVTFGFNADFEAYTFGYLEGEVLANAFRDRAVEFSMVGENGRGFIVLDYFSLEIDITQTDETLNKSNPYYINIDTTTDTGFRVDNNVVVESLESSPFYIKWTGETGLFGFVDEFFALEIFPDFSISTFLFLGVGCLLIGMIVKLFLGG